MFKYVIALGLGAAGSALAQEVSVPSGIDVRLFDVILEEDAALARFRFVASAIGGSKPVGFTQIADDFQYLCEALVIPGLAANGWTAQEVVISLSEKELPFGEMSSEITQYFQPFSVQGKTCIWEEF